jgi:hypothetical protein
LSKSSVRSLRSSTLRTTCSESAQRLRSCPTPTLSGRAD